MNDDDTPTIPLATPSLCPRCSEAYGQNGLFCEACHVELIEKLRRRVNWGVITDWPPTESFAGQHHAATMQDSANLVEEARRVRAHCPRTLQVAQIISRAEREYPWFWTQGDIPL